MKYVNVAIDNNNDNTDRLYTYGCKFEDVKIGQKIFVPFNRGNKVKVAYIFEIMDQLDNEVKGLKYVESVDQEIYLNMEMIETCVWMKQRYLCRYIEAINGFTPTGTKSKRGKERNPHKETVGEKMIIESLTDEQNAVLSRIFSTIGKAKQHTFLLHGVTSSGKTEVYMQTIAKVIDLNKNAIMLVPEISLTKQIIERFIGRFGAENIAVLHSKLSLGERFDEWARIREGKVKIVIGARSAIFAPLENIGAIILDEEHEATYKSDMSPKYDTVEVALKRGNAHKSTIILGSATPSIVSSIRAEEKIYEKLSLKERYNKNQLPEVEVIDMRDELKNGNTSILSSRLYHEMKENLEDGKQVILFLNRRGYSTFVSCRECGYVMKCPECGISLTYHKEKGEMLCHYCGYKTELPKECPNCKGKYIKYFGTGTEKVEEYAREMFEGFPVARLDFDTTKQKGNLDKILNDFRNNKTKILVGTQIVAKGLDFHNVGLVGIIAADVALNIPDFKSAERTFQLITQAAGRTGRGEAQGKVVIQTYNPEHYAIIHGANQDYEGFYQMEKTIRNGLGYPPYVDIIQIIISNENEKNGLDIAGLIYERLMKTLGIKNIYTIFKPNQSIINKHGNLFRYHIIIKAKRGSRKEYIKELEKIKKDYTIGIDINPYSLM
jgi:primosomal protein N' (replication factor Y)